MDKRLGKILKVSFGVGGYQDVQFGLHVTLGDSGWGVGMSKACWDPARMERSEFAKWTEADRDVDLVMVSRYVSKLLKDANVSDVSQLLGKPVEVTFDGNTLKDWRILTEVI
jgi:hypothetical protein